MFPSLPVSPTDPIFAIAEEAKKAGPEAINATIGMFMDEEGKPLMFGSVRKALKEVADTLPARTYGYRHLLGVPEYRRAVTKLIDSTETWNVASIATTGGTGGVALNLRLTRLMQPDVTAILPMPAWPNYKRLLQDANIPCKETAHLLNGKADPTGIIDALRQQKGPVVIILQTGCHNPTGMDFGPDQWKDLAASLQRLDAIALMDMPYQGLAGTPEEDAAPIRLFAESGIPTLVSWSASKNHSLYSERVGLAACVCLDEATKTNVEGHYCIVTRSIHSGSASLGQEVVACVQTDHQKEWLQDMQKARDTLRAKREFLQKHLPDDLASAVKGNGMFAMLALSKEEITALKTEHKVFLTGDGRINVAGIPMQRLEEFCEKISLVHR